MFRERQWHALDINDVLKELNTSERGISEEESKRRIGIYGYNEIVSGKRKSPLIIFLDQFKSILIAILIIASILSVILGEIIDAAVIIAIIILCAFLGFIQEYKAEKSLELVKKLAAPTAKVLRNGRISIIQARDLVPGDIILLEAGDRVPADGRLIKSMNLRVNESVLTGESVQVEKKANIVLPEKTPVPDRINMIFLGTHVTYGRGLAVVTSTGMRTEFGKIAGALQEIEREETPLQRRMNKIGRWLGILSVGICMLVAFLGLLKGYSPVSYTHLTLPTN